MSIKPPSKLLVDPKTGITLPAPVPEKRYSWRTALRKKVGNHAERIWEILLDIAEGRAIQTELPDGRIGPPIIPTAADRTRAAIEMAHMLCGRPVDQTQITAADREASDMEAVRALSDEELQARAKDALTRGLAALDARKAQNDAEGSGGDVEETVRTDSNGGEAPGRDLLSSYFGGDGAGGG